MDSRLEDDMGVNVGDTVVNHYHPRPERDVTVQPAVQPMPRSSVPNWFYAALLGLALIATGALLWMAFSPSEPVTTQPPPVFDVIVAE